MEYLLCSEPLKKRCMQSDENLRLNRRQINKKLSKWNISINYREKYRKEKSNLGILLGLAMNTLCVHNYINTKLSTLKNHDRTPVKGCRRQKMHLDSRGVRMKESQIFFLVMETSQAACETREPRSRHISVVKTAQITRWILERASKRRRDWAGMKECFNLLYKSLTEFTWFSHAHVWFLQKEEEKGNSEGSRKLFFSVRL